MMTTKLGRVKKKNNEKKGMNTKEQDNYTMKNSAIRRKIGMKEKNRIISRKSLYESNNNNNKKLI